MATTSGFGNEKVFRLTQKHFEIALRHFKKDVENVLQSKNEPVSLSYLNYLIFGKDSPVADDQISDRLKDCHPEITTCWENSQQFVILSKRR